MWLKELVKSNFKNLRILYKSKVVFEFNRYLGKYVLLNLPIVKKKLKYLAIKHNVQNIWMGHFHFEYEKRVSKNLQIKILEAYAYRRKVYEEKDWIFFTDIHLWFVNYKSWELEKLEKYLDEDKMMLCLGDLTEKYLSWDDYNDAEKRIIEKIVDKVKKWKLVRLVWNHDSPDFAEYMVEEYKIGKRLFVHGDRVVV